MRGYASNCLCLLLGAWLALLPVWAAADEPSAGSGFGRIAIPDPVRPARAEACVEPVEIMRREHMNFLDRQRDRTVIDGERSGKYSLVGCMNCHNPINASGGAVSYENPRHFCAGCHAYASVSIDCFECHADRGYGQPANPDVSSGAWRPEPGLTAATLQSRLETVDGD